MKPIDANIALYGFMGSGKSTIGRLLAQFLTRSFVDLDQSIELQHGSSITQMFANRGEEYFRAKEEAAVLSLPLDVPHVLALGGGALLRERNKNHICALYRVYTLFVPFAILKDRLSLKKRPLASYAESLYDSRLTHYQSIGTAIPITTELPTACMNLILEDLHAA